MKNTFKEYYLPEEKEFREIWGKCLFVPDANVLLNLYEYSYKTCQEFIELLRKLENRVWIPHQVGLEFQRNRLRVIKNQLDITNRTKGLIQSLKETAEEEARKKLNIRHHPFLDVQAYINMIIKELSTIEDKLEEEVKKHPDLSKTDFIRDEVTNIFNGKVGVPYDPPKIAEIYKKGEQRYANNIPPGYEDARGADKKEGRAIYGDLVLWLQLIDKAKEEGKPIILIGDDNKEDWWWKAGGKTIGPRPELIEEMRREGGVGFWLYNSDRFSEYANVYLKTKINQQSIDEIRDVKIKNEEQKEQIQEAARTRYADYTGSIYDMINRHGARNLALVMNKSSLLNITTLADQIGQIKMHMGIASTHEAVARALSLQTGLGTGMMRISEDLYRSLGLTGIYGGPLHVSQGAPKQTDLEPEQPQAVETDGKKEKNASDEQEKYDKGSDGKGE